MQFHTQQNDYNQFAAAAAAAYTPNIYYEQQQAMMPPHDALLYDLHDTYAQPLTTSDQMIIPPPSSTTTMIPRAGASATNTSSSNNRKRPKRKQVKNACVNCQKACKKCDDGRPCQRCIKLGLTATCTNSPRKERKKGVKRGPYKKRQQQQQQRSSATAVANKKAVAEQTTWDDSNLAALPYNNGTSDNIVYPQRIITPPLTQQESPLTSSPLSADATYGYATTTTAVECDGSCSSSSPISPNFPINAWDDPLFGLVPTEMAEPIMVQDLASIPPAIPPQYPSFDDTAAVVSHDMMTKTQQYYYPVAEEPMCTSCIPQQSLDMTYNGNHYHMYNQQYMQQQQQQQQHHHNGYWQTFLTNA
ncbi:hypothetical protein K492DRAFT_190278 [Lichtheimia hyalospora FSU 10163]|nr:hypothetical protein K492DRAFT_190278 [Lichtheimia hyalospora FSU 10163]